MKNDGQRAVRLPIHLPVRYRCLGRGGWRQGLVENISRSGLLFSTDELVDVGTSVEMSFVLPVRASPPVIVCRGRVVRTVPHGLAGWPPALAATITTYRFVRPQNERMNRPG